MNDLFQWNIFLVFVLNSYFALCVDGCVFLQEKFGDFHVSVFGGQMERSETSLGRRRVRSSVFQQNSSHLPCHHEISLNQVLSNGSLW